ncbi:MAG: serine/threonine phosphatase [Nostocales cyanobacterium]|nr:MAG: serine/threonine phosphatase [Nostocales cyanobacterium]TAF15610.1 MAG: serine/threonine phosphatase [Nostocales cyanobacterium]
MLICPDCKFENPNDNKFCQSCGTSLTNKTCPKCGADVSFNTRYCKECGAESGTLWLAIITQNQLEHVPVEDEKLLQAKAGQDYLAKLNIGSFIDRGKRYQLLEPLSNAESLPGNTQFIVSVLDCQPFQISPLEAIKENQPQGLVIPSLSVIGIPKLAQAYVKLQDEIPPAIPVIHDAWQQDNIQFVLIEDRNHWQSLLDGWQDQNTHPLQRLHWCYQMVQLWNILDTVNCRHSLLNISNLCLDDDQTLGLKRLYTATSTDNSPTNTIGVKALGRLWYSLCKQSQRTELGSMVQMLTDLETDKISTIEELKTRLEEIATELQPSSTTVSTSTTQIQNPSSVTILQDEDWSSMEKNEDTPTIILSMQLRSLEDTGRTDVGKQRDHNEDYFGIESIERKLELPRKRYVQGKGLYILCDGMGGHAGGEVASELAVNTLKEYFKENWTDDEELPSADTIKKGVLLANQAIYDLNQKGSRSGVGRMGTTLVMLLVQNTKLAFTHVGDSRLYRFTRKFGLQQMTVDHEVGQREIAKGVEPSIAYQRPDAYQLTQALGPRDINFVHPEVDFLEIREDTLLLLVSDGLSDNDLVEQNYQTHLAPLLNSGSNLESGLSELIDLANEYNGHDNITGILIRLKVSPNQQI